MGYKKYSHHFEEDELVETAMAKLQTAVEALERNLDELSNNIDSESFMGLSLTEAYTALAALRQVEGEGSSDTTADDLRVDFEAVHGKGKNK